LSMITPPGTTLRRSPFGRAIYTSNSDLVRDGVPASPHHGVGLRATAFHRS
jgi:lipoprotein-anchoring transpeptidase ErfK/SrfK